MPKIFLDPEETADSLGGCRTIETEIDFLVYALSGEDLLIRGETLCQWAETFYSGRSISCGPAPSLVRDLMRTYGDISSDQAYFLSKKIRDGSSPIYNYSPQEILGACYPTYLWDAPASKEHAADWLLWLDKNEPNDAFQPVFSPLLQDWKHDEPELSEIYDATTPDAARLVLEKWLGADITPFVTKFGEFPRPVSSKWIDHLSEVWASKMVKTRGAFFINFLRAPTLWQLKVALAKVALEYFERNPDLISVEICNQISRFVHGRDAERLAKLRPTALPSAVPESPDDVLKWFVNEYLPFKSWHLGTNSTAASIRAMELGRQFAEWYLAFYPIALNSKKYVSFFQSQNLRSEYPDSVNLMVILDGLHCLDAVIVKNALLSGKENRHLEMIENKLCFAPIPTVTEFAKGALVRGAQPSMIKEIQTLGPNIPEKDTPIQEIERAKPGDLIIWRIQQPDSTYHLQNKSTTLRMEVENLLETMAKKILDVIEQVPYSTNLRVFITTDHGRYLGASQKTVDIPSGMEEHGRAAWGHSDKEFTKTGYVIDGEVAFLSRYRYGLESFNVDVAVIISDKSFRDRDKYKKKPDSEKYPHGGLFPEEVILPWMVFARDMEKPKIEWTVRGDGSANQPGALQLTLINPSQLTLTLARCEASFGPDKRFTFARNDPILAYKETQIELEIPSWPSSEQVAIGKFSIMLVLPSGDEFEADPSVTEIRVTELYTRDKSLLEGLDL
jgi:hypothetical protein